MAPLLQRSLIDDEKQELLGGVDGELSSNKQDAI